MTDIDIEIKRIKDEKGQLTAIYIERMNNFNKKIKKLRWEKKHGRKEEDKES